MNSLSDLIKTADTYVAATGLKEQTVSERVLKAGGRIRDLRSGASDIGFNRLQTAVLWFSDNWPEGAEWPADVPRPDKTVVAA